MKKLYETHSMPQTADNVAADFGISRADQDAFALRSQQRWAAAHAAGRFADELVPVEILQKKGDPIVFDTDEHPRPETTLEMLAKLKGVNGPELTVTAGNASGVNDGACALLLASDAAAGQHGLQPRAAWSAWPPPACAAHHGLRPGPGRAQGAGPDRPQPRPDGRHRAQRSLRRPGLAVLRDLAWPTTKRASIPTAAPSPWATRSA
jgi:hypothetical protein